MYTISSILPYSNIDIFNLASFFLTTTAVNKGKINFWGNRVSGKKLLGNFSTGIFSARKNQLMNREKCVVFAKKTGTVAGFSFA